MTWTAFAILAIFWKSCKLFFAISTVLGTTVAHTLYTEKWHWLAKYCGVGKYYNLVRVVASLFYPALALGLQAAHSLRITKWEMLLLYNKQIQLWSTRSNMFLVWNLLLPAICDKRQTSPYCIWCEVKIWLLVFDQFSLTHNLRYFDINHWTLLSQISLLSHIS